MNFSSRRQQKERQILQQNVGYAQGSVRQYLNIKRTSKDRCCTVFFCLFMLVLVMLAGLGFFYGNFTQIGTFVDSTGAPCSKLLSHANSGDTYQCNSVVCGALSPYAYLQHICVDSSFTITTNTLAVQISAYNFGQTFLFMLYVNVGIVIGMLILFLLVIWYRRFIYGYVFLAFLLLLGFSFYLLKTIKDKVDSLTIKYASDAGFASSQLLSDQQSMQPLAYLLLAGYLVLFPVVLFAPAGIKIGVNVLSKMYKYFQSNYTVVIFSLSLAMASYGMVFLIGFLLLNFLTAGTTATVNNSFFYIYQKVYLSNPAVLSLFFVGVYWLFATCGSWQQYVLSSSIVQWYFQDGGKIRPVKKGMKRSWYNLGSAAFDALLLPLQWISLLIYSLAKMDTDTRDQYENQHTEDCFCLNNLLFKMRTLATKFYIKVNRGAPLAGALTNNNYKQSCQLSAVIFAQQKHRFFNVGGSISLFLNLFVMLTFLMINYLALYYQNYNNFPANIGSLGLQVIMAIFLGLAVGQTLSNIFGTTVDAVLFCFLMQKREGTQISENQIKKTLNQLYNAQEEVTQVSEMYELQSDTE